MADAAAPAPASHAGEPAGDAGILPSCKQPHPHSPLSVDPYSPTHRRPVLLPLCCCRCAAAGVPQASLLRLHEHEEGLVLLRRHVRGEGLEEGGAGQCREQLERCGVALRGRAQHLDA